MSLGSAVRCICTGVWFLACAGGAGLADPGPVAAALGADDELGFRMKWNDPLCNFM